MCPSAPQLVTPIQGNAVPASPIIEIQRSHTSSFVKIPRRPQPPKLTYSSLTSDNHPIKHIIQRLQQARNTGFLCSLFCYNVCCHCNITTHGSAIMPVYQPGGNTLQKGAGEVRRVQHDLSKQKLRVDCMHVSLNVVLQSKLYRSSQPKQSDAQFQTVTIFIKAGVHMALLTVQAYYHFFSFLCLHQAVAVLGRGGGPQPPHFLSSPPPQFCHRLLILAPTQRSAARPPGVFWLQLPLNGRRHNVY